MQAVSGEAVELAYVNQGYRSEGAAKAAQANRVLLEVVKLLQAKNDFVLLSHRWVVE